MNSVPEERPADGASQERLTLAAIHAAHVRIGQYIHRTPVMSSSTLDIATGAKLYFKCENLQKAGAFKARGATNAVFSLSDAQAERGVATHSSGNHGAALARAAQLRNIPAYIVVPHNASRAKRAAVQRYGGKLIFCEPTLAAREAAAAQLVAETGAELIHPFDDFRVMAGQGTAAVELLEEVPTLDVILCPIGGGGLASGTAVAAKGMKPSIKVIGTEPAGADDAARSFKSGERLEMQAPHTIADGLRGSLSQRTFTTISQHLDDIVTVSEEAIVTAMRTIWEVMKLVIEPSAAVPYAALIEGKINLQDKRAGIILSGGNLDLNELPWRPSAAG